MKYFVEFVVSSLVQHAEEVDVEMVEKPDGISYLVHLNPLDIGRVIGKKGRTISAIRNLCNAATAKGGKQVQVEIVEAK
jgi:predicted RNA-binding protein YlqC (UPF0109 family)